MKKTKYMKYIYKCIPEYIREHYTLDGKLSHDGYIYVQIKKGRYGLK